MQTKAMKMASPLLVVPLPIRQQVEDRLREAIVTGAFAPGEHMSDRLLCETFGASRSVVREAIRLMEAEGLVEQIPHRGPFVKTLTHSEAEEIYEVRAALESMIGARFARRSTPAERQMLQKAFRDFKREAKGQGRRKNLLNLKKQFYEILSRGSQTSYAAKMLALILNQASQLRSISMAAPERLPNTIIEIQAIVDAVEKGDAKAAARACRDHVVSAAQVALRKIPEG